MALKSLADDSDTKSQAGDSKSFQPDQERINNPGLKASDDRALADMERNYGASGNSVYDPEPHEEPHSIHAPATDLRGSKNLKKVDPYLAHQQKLGAKKDAKTQKIASKIPSSDLRAGGLFNKGGDKKSKVKSRLKKLAKSKTGLYGAGVGAIVIIGIILLVTLVGSLKLPDVMQGIESYEFAQVTNEFTSNSESVTDEALSVEASDDGTFAQLKEKWGNLRDNTWGKLDVYRPSKVIDNLGENNGLKLNFKTSKLTGRQIFTGGEINGQVFDVDQATGIAKWTPGLNRIVEFKNKVAFNQSGFWETVNDTMKTNDTAPLVRGLVFKQLLAESDGSLAGWLLSKFGSKDQATNDAAATSEEFAATQAGATAPDAPAMTQTAEADSAAEAQATTDAANPATVESIDANDGDDPAVLAAADKALNQNLLEDVIHNIGFVYFIVAPICIIFDGSVQQSQAPIDNNMHQQEDAFDQLAAEADQQKNGDISPTDNFELANAVGATNDEIGDISATADIPYQRAYGHPQATNGIPSAEAGSDGSFDYSLLNALGGIPADSIAGKSANWLATHMCGLLTNIYTSIGLALAQIIAAIVSFGGSEAGTEAAGQGAREFITEFLSETITNIFGTKEVTKGASVIEENFLARAIRFAKIQGALTVGTVGLAEIAHLEVASRSGEANNGFAQSTNLVNEADAGGNENANELMRQEFFGRPLTEAEVADAEQSSAVQVNYENSQKSFTQRYFAVDNYDSLITHVGMDLGASNHAGIVASIVRLGSSILRPMSSIASLVGSLTASSTAYAAANPVDYDYGNVQFGWPASEQTVLTSNDSYKMLENQQILDQSGNETAIATKYAACFGYQYDAGGDGNLDPTDPDSDLKIDPQASLGYLLSQQDIWRDNNGNVINGGGLCDPATLSFDNTTDPLAADPQTPDPNGGPTSPQAHDMIFRWRLAMEYLTTVDQLTSAQNVTAD